MVTTTINMKIQIFSFSKMNIAFLKSTIAWYRLFGNHLRFSLTLLMLILICPFIKGQTEYKLTISYDVFGSSFDNTVHVYTTEAVCTSDESKTFEVQWASYNVIYYNWNIYIKKGGGRIYNKTNLGKIKKISYGLSDGQTIICYGNEEDPYNYNTLGENDIWGYFSIRNDNSSKDAKFSTYTITITFEIDDTPPMITLDENSSENSAIISSNLDNTVNVNLSRSLTANMWNAICLPFNLNSDQKEALFGEGYSLQEFSSISNENGGTQLNFQAVATSDDLQAGIPYIVYPTISTVSNQEVTINGVNMASTTEPGTVTQTDNTNNVYTYQGIYVPTRLDNIAEDPKQVLFIGANNKFYWPNTSNPMKAFRAYFILPSAGTSSNVSLSTEEQGVSDGISFFEVTGLDIQGSPNSIYTIHGQVVGSSSDQLPKGIYISNGHKFIVK